MHPLQPGGDKVVEQQRGSVWIPPDMTGKNIDDEVSMLGDKGFQQSERRSLFLREHDPALCRSSRSSITVSCSRATSPLNPSQAIASQSHAFSGKRGLFSHPQPHIAIA